MASASRCRSSGTRMQATSPVESGDQAPEVATSNRRPDIQGLRAIAVLMVVAFHARLPVPGGFVGVDVFFAISGFVITAMLRREWLSAGRIRFKDFYLRRFKRLTPALAVMVMVTILISALVLSPLGIQQTAAETAIGAMLLVANFVIASTTGGYFDAPAESNPLLNTWSLSVEEQFYLVFPALMALGWHLARRRRLMRLSPHLIVAGIAAISFVLAVAGNYGLTFPGSEWILGFYSPFTRAWEFAAGALLALGLARWPRVAPRLVLAGSGITGGVLLTASLWLIDDTTPFPGTRTLLPVTGALLLLLAGSRPSSVTARALSVRPLVRIGDWSYSIYLWHWPLIVFAVYLWPQSTFAAPIAAVISIAPALVSYKWVEQPLRSLPDLGRARTAVLVACVTVPAVVAAVIVGQAANHYWMPKYASGEMSKYRGDIGHDEFHAYVQSHYFPCTPEDIRRHALYWGDFLRCQQSLPSAPVQVALVGDSHAEHLFLGLAEAFPHTNIAYYILSELPIRSASDDMARIIGHVAREDSIRTVIVTAAWKIRGVPVAELESTVREFTAAGKRVFITDDVPDFPFDPVQCRDRKAPILTETECTAENRKSNDADVGDLRDVAGAVPGVQMLETSKNFCSGDICSMTNGRNLLYRDYNHLNMIGSRFLAKWLVANADFAEAMSPDYGLDSIDSSTDGEGATLRMKLQQWQSPNDEGSTNRPD